MKKAEKMLMNYKYSIIKENKMNLEVTTADNKNDFILTVTKFCFMQKDRYWISRRSIFWVSLRNIEIDEIATLREMDKGELGHTCEGKNTELNTHSRLWSVEWDWQCILCLFRWHLEVWTDSLFSSLNN